METNGVGVAEWLQAPDFLSIVQRDFLPRGTICFTGTLFKGQNCHTARADVRPGECKLLWEGPGNSDPVGAVSIISQGCPLPSSAHSRPGLVGLELCGLTSPFSVLEPTLFIAITVTICWDEDSPPTTPL